MNIFNYTKKISKIFDDNNILLEYISNLSEKHETLKVGPDEIQKLQSNNTGQTIANVKKIIDNIDAKTNSILKEIREKRPNEIYDLINKIITELNLVDKAYNDNNNLIIDLKEFAELHTDAYSEKTAHYVYKFLESALRINFAFNDLKEKCNFIIKNEFDQKYIPDNYSNISINTDQDVPLISDFASILNSIDNLYEFICIIYKIDPKTNKLMIKNISTGSWFTDLIGAEQAIKSLERLLIGLGNFIRDVVTGKIGLERFENECSKYEAFIDLVEKAREAGINNPEVGLSKHLKPIIKNLELDITTLEINETEILGLNHNEKLTLIKNKSKRTELVDNIKQIEVKK